jgi:DNA polymerase-3 subunit delta
VTDTTDIATIPVTLLKGDDESILRDAVRLLVDDLVGTEDRALMVEEVEVGPPSDDGDPLLILVDAAQTPPLFTDVRVVLGRVTEKRERGELVQPLVDYLQDPLPSSRLVLEWRGKVPKALTEAIAHIGGAVVDTSPGRKVGEWVAEHLADAGLKVDSEGRSRLVTWVGDEPSRLLGLLDLLRSTYGAGVKITAAEIEPFLGDDGGVPPWDLTDAIDRGDRAAALELLQRMIGQGDRHPFQVLGTLHSHFARMLRLDGAGVTGEKEAAELLGLKGSTFPAKKALGQSRRLGHERVVRAIDLLAEADLDLRGGKAWPDHLVLEVLVARLATMSR